MSTRSQITATHTGTASQFASGLATGSSRMMSAVQRSARRLSTSRNRLRRGRKDQSSRSKRKMDPNDFVIIPPSQYQLPGVIVPDDTTIKAPAAPRPIFVKNFSSTTFEATLGKKGPGAAAKGKEFAFSEIVDEDNQEAYENYLSDELAGRLIDSALFRIFILGVIVLNAIQTGVTTSPTVEQTWGSLLGAIDSIFMTIFVMELLLKWYHGFWAFWKSSWNVFDFIIVFVSLVGQGATFVSSSLVLRILRVLRAFRSLRSISALQGLQIIVKTIIRSIPSMINVLALLLMVMFIYSVMGVTLFGEVAPAHFGSMSDAMFSNFVLLTQDGWVDIFFQLDEAGQFTAAALYFVSFIVVGAFVFVNVVVGVTVNLLQQAYREIRQAKRAKRRKLRRQRQRDYGELYRATVDVKSIPPMLWRAQQPREIPNFDRLTSKQVRNYFLVIAEMEACLLEFSKLRSELTAVAEEVKVANASLAVQDDLEEIHEEEDDLGEEEDFSGDALTQLIKRAKAKEKREREDAERKEKRSAARRMHIIEHMQEEQSRTTRARLWAMGSFVTRPEALEQDTTGPQSKET